MRIFSVLLLAALMGLSVFQPVSAAPNPKPPGKERLVLMPLRVDAEDQKLQATMETALAEELEQKYEVFAGDRVREKAKEIFGKESKTAKRDCDETRCMQDIAMAFQAELIAVANVTRQPNGYFLSLNVQNVMSEEAVYSRTLPCKGCDAFQVVDKLKELAGASASATSAKEATGPVPKPEMVVIPAGTYFMGNNNGAPNEKPVHRVSVKSFAIAKFLVTQAQWQAVMGSNPSHFSACGGDCPVENVTWDEVHDFIRRLNERTGEHYRLPVEAEWEYACYGGQLTKYPKYCGGDDLDSLAWYGGNSNNTTHPVGQKRPNGYGLYDMSGNVWEWLEDTFHESYNGAPADGSEWMGSGEMRVLRGNAWMNPASYVRASARVRNEAASRRYFYGFRLAKSLP